MQYRQEYESVEENARGEPQIGKGIMMQAWAFDLFLKNKKEISEATAVRQVLGPDTELGRLLRRSPVLKEKMKNYWSTLVNASRNERAKDDMQKAKSRFAIVAGHIDAKDFVKGHQELKSVVMDLPKVRAMVQATKDKELDDELLQYERGYQRLYQKTSEELFAFAKESGDFSHPEQKSSVGEIQKLQRNLEFAKRVACVAASHLGVDLHPTLQELKLQEHIEQDLTKLLSSCDQAFGDLKCANFWAACRGADVAWIETLEAATQATAGMKLMANGMPLLESTMLKLLDQCVKETEGRTAVFRKDDKGKAEKRGAEAVGALPTPAKQAKTDPAAAAKNGESGDTTETDRTADLRKRFFEVESVRIIRTVSSFGRANTDADDVVLLLCCLCVVLSKMWSVIRNMRQSCDLI